MPPVTWQVLGVFLFLSILATGLFLSLASYSKSTTVQGSIQTDRGVVRASAARSGIVEQMLVTDGQHVAQGQPLVRISVATTESGASLEERRMAAIERHSQSLDGQAPIMLAESQAKLASLQAQIAGGEAELGSLSDQIAQQRDMVSGAERDLEKIKTIADRGFISANEIRNREDKASQRRQDLARLAQDQATRRAQIAVARADMAKARSELSLQIRNLEGQKADIQREAAENGNARTMLVTAGVSGVVTGLTAHRGDAVDVGRPMLSIVPDGSHLQAVLDVPATAAGFIEAGQPVRLSVDAYPYQTYGTIQGKVTSISDAAIPRQSGSTETQDVFLVHAHMSSDSVKAYGQPRMLRPGMTVSARITTRRRSLMGLLFDPLYAVAKR